MNNIPLPSRVISVREYFGGSLNAVFQYQPYLVPDEAAFLYVLAITGGAPGGTPTVGAAASGGGGGAGGGITKALIPAFLLPKQLWVQVSSPTPPGQTLIPTALLTSPSTYAVNNTIVIGRTGGAGAGSGAGGTASGTMTRGDAAWSGLALFESDASNAGAAGTSTNGGLAAVLNTMNTCGGGGGGGSSGGTGGGVSGIGPFPTVATTTAGENPGLSGYTVWRPFVSAGGAGGGGLNGAVTGLAKGGNGGIGSGGGGGGNGTSGTPGAGGAGGAGYMAIIAF